MKLLRVLAFLAFAIFCRASLADVLVRSCDVAGPSCAKWAWVLPANAKAVQVNRAATPFVTLADVQPTERVASCYEDPGVTAGSTTVCAARVPGRTDLWQLKSVLYPVAAPAPTGLQLVVDAANPRWEGVRSGGRPVFAEELPNLGVRLYGAPEGQVVALLDSAPWAATVNFHRDLPPGERWCFTASLTMTTDSAVSAESPQTVPWCGTSLDPPPVLHLVPPNSITGQAP
jgi:hypothetical protein